MKRVMTGCALLRRVVLTTIVALPASAWGQSWPCWDYLMGACELQVQAPVTYTGWQTQGWAYYCTGDHPYYQGANWNVYNAFTFDNSCFSVAENRFAEGQNKFDALITNWCVTTQQITVTLACFKHYD